MRAYRPHPDGKSVYHPTWYHGPSLAAWDSLPIVLTIHDLIPEKWPGVTSPAQLLDRREAIRKAKTVICVSESTRAELGVHYPWATEKSEVALLGISDLAGEVEPRESSRPYFVHVGKRGAYKDFATIVRALSITPSDIQVVAAGGGPRSEREQEMLTSKRLESRVHFQPDLTDEALAQLLDGSKGLISASREEGFGLPALEALARGRPVILADIAVYRELFRKWGRFFPPGDHEALASAVLAVLQDPPVVPLRSDLDAAFSWTETARITASAYDRAVS
jgi:glycosyltransferase involved in cell wall biosynthesis